MVPSSTSVLVVDVPMCVSSSSSGWTASLPPMSGGAGGAAKGSVGGIGGGACAARPGKLLSTKRAWGDTYLRLFSGQGPCVPVGCVPAPGTRIAWTAVPACAAAT
eukprot:1930075-Pleurochrysis_carterae.AAC.1